MHACIYLFAVYLIRTSLHVYCKCQKFLSAGPISARLFRAIQLVESGGESDPENAVGDGGRAIGPYQIHESYWKDAKDFDSSLVAKGETYQNCKGPGSFNYSERVMQVAIT